MERAIILLGANLYLWDHGVIDLGTEKYLLAVSTDAKYIYYSTDALGERDFCIQLGPTSDTVIEFAHYGYDNAPDLVFNYDGSEVILDRLYGWDELYIKGEKSARMSGTTFFPNTAIWRSNGSPSASVFSANVKTYANGLYYIYDSPLISFYFIGNNGIIEDFAIDVYKSGATPVKGNSEIICRVDDRIIRYIEKGGKVSEETLVSQNATDLSVAEDGSRFYYQDNNHALYLVEGKKKAKLVAEAVDEWPYGFRLFGNKVFNNKYVYYLSNGNLYCADGDQTQKIDVLNGTLKELHLESSFVWIITTLDRRDCVYYSSDGLNFRQLE